MENRKYYHWFVVVATQLVVTTVLILASDRLVCITLDHMQTRKLQSMAASGASDVTDRVAALQQEVVGLHAELTHRSARHIPSPDELRTIAIASHISIRRLERVNRGKAANTGETYSIALSGRPVNLIAYMHEVWEKFSLVYEQVGLQRSDEFGDTATLTLTCLVATP